jgi:hypothetical protein
LRSALKVTIPPDLEEQVRARAAAYHADALASAEDAREADRARKIADHRARLVDGPVLVLRQSRLGRSFNPDNLEAFGASGTVYPTGSFVAQWGTLEVTADGAGALVSSDFQELRVALPADTSGTMVHGKGWTLELQQGWRVAPGERPGDLVVAGR